MNRKSETKPATEAERVALLLLQTRPSGDVLDIATGHIRWARQLPHASDQGTIRSHWEAVRAAVRLVQGATAE